MDQQTKTDIKETKHAKQSSVPHFTAESMKLLSPKHHLMLFSPSTTPRSNNNSQQSRRETPKGEFQNKFDPSLFAISEKQADQEESSKWSVKSVNLPLSKIVIGCLVTICLTNCAYSIIAPFLPLYFKQYDVSKDQVGLIFSMYSIGIVIFSPFAGQMNAKLGGKRNALQISVLVLGISIVSFGFLAFVKNKNAILTLALGNRLLQGLSATLIYTTIYSIGLSYYPEQADAFIGYIEAFTGIGLIVGPILGSTLFELAGFQCVFYCFGGFFIFTALFVKQVFKASIDNQSEAGAEQNLLDIEGESSRQSEKIQPIGPFELLKYPCFLLAALSSTLVYCSATAMEPILALRMKEFNLTQEKIGLFFTIYPIFYIFTNLLYAYIPLNVNRRYILIMASMLSAFVNLLVGPSKVAHLPNSLNVMMAGQALRGVIDPFLFIPVLPEMIASVTPYYHKNQEGLINDSASGLFCMFYGLGMILGPIFGSAVTEKYGFQTCFDLMAAICLGYAFIYLVVSEVYLYGWGSKDFENVNKEDSDRSDALSIKEGEETTERAADLGFALPGDEEEARPLLASATRKAPEELTISTSVLNTPECSPQNSGPHNNGTQGQLGCEMLFDDRLSSALKKLQTSK